MATRSGTCTAYLIIFESVWVLTSRSKKYQISDPLSVKSLSTRGPGHTRAPAPPTDWNSMKKRELEFLDVSFPKSVAPMRSPQKSHVGQPVRIHRSESTDQNPPIRIYRFETRSIAPVTMDSAPERDFARFGRNAGNEPRTSRSRAVNARCAQNLAPGPRPC